MDPEKNNDSLLFDFDGDGAAVDESLLVPCFELKSLRSFLERPPYARRIVGEFLLLVHHQGDARQLLRDGGNDLDGLVLGTQDGVDLENVSGVGGENAERSTQLRIAD